MKSAIYTRTGDTGTTALVGGSRVDKDHPRLEAYGTIDELNSHLGLLASIANPDPDVAALITEAQNKMFCIGAYLATPAPSHPDDVPGLDEADIERIEEVIDRLDATVPPLRAFILPAGCTAACAANVARTVCRRAERRIITLGHSVGRVAPIVVQYVNRLSDFLFIYARYLNISSQTEETPWHKE